MTRRAFAAATAAAVREALRSTYRVRVGAVIVHPNGSILNTACNRSRAHDTLHAEIALLDQCAYPFGCSVVVVRVLVDGKLSMARPCARCRRALRAEGIHHVYYSDWCGKIIEEQHRAQP